MDTLHDDPPAFDLGNKLAASLATAELNTSPTQRIIGGQWLAVLLIRKVLGSYLWPDIGCPD